MAIPTFDSAGAITALASASSVSPPFSAGNIGDIIVGFGYNKYSQSFAVPSKWSSITSISGRILVWIRTGSAASGSCTLAASGGSGFIMGVCYRFAGCITEGTPYEALNSGSSGSGGTVPCYSITTLGPDRLACNFASIANDVGSNDDGETYSEADEQQTTVGTDGQFDLYTYGKASQGVIPFDAYRLGGLAVRHASTLALIPSSLPSGYANDVLGVASANLGKVMGVLSADIAKVNGV